MEWFLIDHHSHSVMHGLLEFCFFLNGIVEEKCSGWLPIISFRCKATLLFKSSFYLKRLIIKNVRIWGVRIVKFKSGEMPDQVM